MKLAIVGIFFDGYYDLWEDFLEIFRMNWPDCPFPLYIVNQTKDLDFDKDYGVEVLHAGEDAEYSRKLQVATEEIDADYYLILLEDYFIGDKLQKDHLDPILRFIEDNRAKYYGFNMNLYGCEDGHESEPQPIDGSSEYTIVSGNNIFERDFLVKCVGKRNYNAWVFEGIYAKSRDAHSSKFLEGCYKDRNNYLHILHGALQGKFLPHAYRHFADMGYSFHTDRDMLSESDAKKAKMKRLLKMKLPKVLLDTAKVITRTNGVLDKYDNDIREEIRELGLQ